MKKKLLFCILSFSLVAAVLYGCGGGTGSPGSGGTEDTGVVLDAEVIGLYLDENTGSCDAFRDMCEDEPEPFTDHQANATFTATLINPNPTVRPGTLYIDKYTVEFRRSNDSLGAPPIETDTRFVTIVIFPPLSGTISSVTTGTVTLVDLIRKEKYRDDVLSGLYDYHLAFINNYTAVFTFFGKNEYGEDFKVKTQIDFQIGNFDYCQ
ncbi:MAG: hypothetical protein AB1442_08405 [Nitrospirota bacterium]